MSCQFQIGNNLSREIKRALETERSVMTLKFLEWRDSVVAKKTTVDLKTLMDNYDFAINQIYERNAKSLEKIPNPAILSLKEKWEKKEISSKEYVEGVIRKLTAQ